MVILERDVFLVNQGERTNRDGLFDETAKIMELCDTQARLSPDGEKAKSCNQPVSRFDRNFDIISRVERDVRDEPDWNSCNKSPALVILPQPDVCGALSTSLI